MDKQLIKRDLLLIELSIVDIEDDLVYYESECLKSRVKLNLLAIRDAIKDMRKELNNAKDN